MLITGRDAASPASAPPVLWVVGVDGSAPRRVPLEWRGGIRAATLSADGRRLAFTGAKRKGELWSITNLLAQTTAANARR